VRSEFGELDASVHSNKEACRKTLYALAALDLT